MEQFEQAKEHQSRIAKLLDDSFEYFDVILSLSTASHAPLRNEKEKDDPSLIWNMCGNPTISMPVTKTQEGFPLGIQAVSRRYNDKMLLRFVSLLRNRELIPDAPNPKLDL